ncbi:MAG: ABC transporter permease subunit [Phycisphaerales bacterium]
MPVLLRWLLGLAPLNPIAVRLVQNGSRRTRHLYIRSAYLAVLIVVLLWALLLNTDQDAMSYRALAEAGASSFEWIAYLQIGLICVLAPVFMAGAIAQEANPRTWDILLTTPLSSLQIVLGNLLGRLFFVLALLACSLPLFALTQFFGGVPGRSIFASYAVAGCAAVLVGAIAIALSVSRLVGRRAVFAFYVSVVTYIAVTWAIDYGLTSVGRGAGPAGAGVTWMTAINPFLALNALLNPSGYPRAEAGPGVQLSGLAAWFLGAPVTTWCVGSLLLSLALIGASTFTVRAGGLGAIGVGSVGVPWYRRAFGLGGAGAEHRAPRPVWVNPIAWREAAARNATLGRVIARWSFIAVGGAWGASLVVMHFTGVFTTATLRIALLATVWAELAVATLVAINMAATAISREREDGTLDLLIITPITASQYLTGKLRGLVAYMLPLLAVPIGTLLIAGLYALFEGLGVPGGVMIAAAPAGWTGTGPISAPFVLPESGLVAAVVVVPFIAASVMVGLNWSLRRAGTLGAVVVTVAVVGVISGVVGLCGWNSGSSFPYLGPALAALSPASLVYSLVDPVGGATRTVIDQGGRLTATRLALAAGSVAGAMIYLFVVYGIHLSMVKDFDKAMRNFAGAR